MRPCIFSALARGQVPQPSTPRIGCRRFLSTFCNARSRCAQALAPRTTTPPRHPKTHRRSTIRVLRCLHALRLDRCRTLVQRGARTRSETGAGARGTQRRLRRAESARRGAHGHQRRAHALIVASRSRSPSHRGAGAADGRGGQSARCGASGGVSAGLGRRVGRVSEGHRAAAACAGSRSHQIPRIADKAAPAHPPRFSRKCS